MASHSERTFDVRGYYHEVLKRIFPECVSFGGMFELPKFIPIIDEYLQKNADSYRMTFPGKHMALQSLVSPEFLESKVDANRSLNFNQTRNCFYVGDNLSVMKLLLKSHFGKIKFIYIDPPYNTGKNFVYSDSLMHDQWLQFMYPRLEAARLLLREDGIFVASISDQEVANLKRIMDEIFGSNNFLGTIMWRSTSSVTNTALFSVGHTYNLAYAKNIEQVRLNADPKVNSSWWDDIKTTKEATNHLKRLFGQILFDSPKPVELIMKFIRLCDPRPNDTVLDFFAGSGTTGEAVMQWNSTYSNHQLQFICVQMPEPVTVDSLAAKAGYNSVDALAIERLKKAANVLHSKAVHSKNHAPVDNADIGFKVTTVTSTQILHNFSDLVEYDITIPSFSNLPARIKTLQQYIPGIFSENLIHIAALSERIGIGSLWEPEKSQLNWMNRQNIVKYQDIPPWGKLVLNKERSINENSTHNVIISGENSEILKILQIEYRNRIKFLWVDPPALFEPEAQLLDLDIIHLSDEKTILQRLKDHYFQIKAGLSSCNQFALSNWIGMLYLRLNLAYSLVKDDDGIIALMADDNTFTPMREILNEIYGEKNFMGTVIWKCSNSPSRSTPLNIRHRFIIIYAKNKAYFTVHRAHFKLPFGDPENEGFTNPNNDDRGPWKADPFEAGEVNQHRPNQHYGIINPNTGVEHFPNPNCCWKNDFTRYQQLVKEDRLYFGKDGTARPTRKRFYYEVKHRGKTVKSWWDDLDLRPIILDDPTNTDKFIAELDVKPVDLLKKLLMLGTIHEHDIVMDIFAGSGSLAQAVLEFNAETLISAQNSSDNIQNGYGLDSPNRINLQFICIQIPVPFRTVTNYEKITDLTYYQIRKTILRLKSAPGLDNLDLGLQYFELH
jgi:adenine specific DNA methylase Mod